MAKLTRRGFIKQASIGAGALGVLATGATDVSPALANNTETPAVQTPAVEADADRVAAEGPLMVVVSNPNSGKIIVMHGEQERTIDNPLLARSLMSL